MGRSNGSEAARKRADAAKRHEKYAKEGQSQNAVNAAAMSLVCQKCFQSFMVTQRKMCEQHHEQKHPKDTLLECFPNLEEATANTGAGKKDQKKK
jgi:hypothetical protein